MRKIPTLFRRDPEDMRRVLPEVTPGCEWVVQGRGYATRKYDGTCVMFDGTGWWARRELKPGNTPPPGYRTVETDPNTGKTVGWEPATQSPFSKYLAAEAIPRLYLNHKYTPIGTYELIGPRINGNPENVEEHALIEHEVAERFRDVPRDFAGMRAWLLAHDYEGIVWHRIDGSMAKIKRRDFDFEVTH